jgi:uncharacterized protein with PIN domain
MRPAEIRFAADAMLQSLATWLRLLGYDCAGGPRQFGRALLEQSIAEDRVFLTRNTHLGDDLPHALLARGQIVHVLEEHLPQQLREVVGKFLLDGEHFVFTRCVGCNQALHPVDRSAAASRVPPDVAAGDGPLWECPSCHKIYWHGSHVTNSLTHLHHWLAATPAVDEDAASRYPLPPL